MPLAERLVCGPSYISPTLRFAGFFSAEAPPRPRAGVAPLFFLLSAMSAPTNAAATPSHAPAGAQRAPAGAPALPAGAPALAALAAAAAQAAQAAAGGAPAARGCVPLSERGLAPWVHTPEGQAGLRALQALAKLFSVDASVRADQARGVYTVVFTGAGSQGFLLREKGGCCVREAKYHFEVDAKVARAAKAGRCSAVTLNVTVQSEHVESFHGSLLDASVPETHETFANLDRALARLETEAAGATALHLVFLGVGFTAANGKGFKEYLRQVGGRYRCSVSVVDITPELSRKRRAWLHACLGKDVDIAFHKMTAKQAVRHLPAGTLPADFLEQVRNIPPEAWETNDQQMLSFLVGLHRDNKLRVRTCGKRTRSSRHVRPKKKLKTQAAGN